MARDAFATFIPISVESDARTNIIFDFFDLMAAIAAHGRTNGLGGRKLSRYAGWWAFEHSDGGNGFDGGYKSWARFAPKATSYCRWCANQNPSAADATSHLFFAYLRSLSPDSVRGINGISTLPLSLQALAQETEYPPETPSILQMRTTKVVMIVDSVSPTPFSLLRRAKHFEYRDDDRALQQFADYEDPIQALTDECRRVLQCISSTNQSQVSNSKASTGLVDASWSRFEDIGFGGSMDDSDNEGDANGSALGKKRPAPQGLRSTPHSRTQDFGRPTTPSWADFLSSGFVDEEGSKGPKPLLLPPDKILPPINTRGMSSQSHKRMADEESNLEPGELASINAIDLDDSFWWVWITSLAGEEPTQRKAVFGRCALIETNIIGGKWLVMEEMVKGAAPEPEAGAYIAEKKSRFGFTKRGRMTRRKSTGKKNQLVPPHDPYARAKTNPSSIMSKTSIGPDQHARIQAAAAALQQKQKHQDMERAGLRRGRDDDVHSTKTNSVFTLQPVIMSEAAPAMRWANTYDKDTVRAAYLGNNFAGRGMSDDMLPPGGLNTNGTGTNGTATPTLPRKEPVGPGGDYGFPSTTHGLPGKQPSYLNNEPTHDRDLPALPREKLEQLAPETPPSEQTPLMPPAPLPEPPVGNMQQYNRAATQAAEVALPESTPMEQPREFAPERQPLRSLDQNQAHTSMDVAPTYPRPMSPDRDRSTSFSADRRSPPGKKLKKRAPGGGLKGFFGRKRMDVPGVIIASEADNNAALAAARAALQGPQSHQTAVTAPPQTTLGRRFSGVRKKGTPNAVPFAPSPAGPIHDIDDEPTVSSAEATPIESPRFEPPQRNWHDSQQSLSGIDHHEKRQAEKEFSSFDQGPLVDQPAVLPQESPDGRGSSEFATPAETGMHPMAQDTLHDDASEKSIELAREVSPLQDRWAQIRKNAAERAARLSEEQTKPGQTGNADEGDTSGEESECLPMFDDSGHWD